MFDTRHPKELEAIKVTAEMYGIDPTDMLADPAMDLVAASRRINFIRAVREALQLGRVTITRNQ